MGNWIKEQLLEVLSSLPESLLLARWEAWSLLMLSVPGGECHICGKKNSYTNNMHRYTHTQNIHKFWTQTYTNTQILVCPDHLSHQIHKIFMYPYIHLPVLTYTCTYRYLVDGEKTSKSSFHWASANTEKSHPFCLKNILQPSLLRERKSFYHFCWKKKN